MPSVEYSMTGTDKLRNALLHLLKATPERMAAQVHGMAEEAMTESKKRTPVDLGDLKRSGNVKPPVVTKDSISVRMGYGDTAVNYALFVHEDVNARHKVGRSHYLSSVIDELRPKFLKKLSVRMSAYGKS